MGLISEVVDTGASLSRATELATAIAQLNRGSSRGTKKCLNEWMRGSFDAIFKHGLAQGSCHFSTRGAGALRTGNQGAG